MSCRCCHLQSAIAVGAGVAKVWDSKADFERCTWDGNIEVTDEGTVRLKKSVLLQDEQGATHYANTEQLSETVWAKKLFVIEDPACDKAELYVFGSAKKVMVNGRWSMVNGQWSMVNGQWLTEGKRLPSTGWQVWDVPPKLLRKGINEFIFSGGGHLLIENSLYPNRSAKSVDCGRTWEFDHLGFGGVENGEYVVRLRLVQYPRKGVITSEVVDLARNGKEVAPLAKVRDVQVKVDGDAAQIEV